MTEGHLRILGFKKQTDESDSANPFYYYTLNFTQGLSFITNANDETRDDEWYIEFFNTEIPVRYYDYDKAKTLINLIKDGMVSFQIS